MSVTDIPTTPGRERMDGLIAALAQQGTKRGGEFYTSMVDTFDQISTEFDYAPSLTWSTPVQVDYEVTLRYALLVAHAGPGFARLPGAVEGTIKGSYAVTVPRHRTSFPDVPDEYILAESVRAEAASIAIRELLELGNGQIENHQITITDSRRDGNFQFEGVTHE